MTLPPPVVFDCMIFAQALISPRGPAAQCVERVRRGQATVGDATLLYERMLDLLKRRGYQKPAWFTPTEFARSLPSGQLGTAVTEFTGQYNALRFGRRTEVAPRLSMLLDELARQ